MESINRQNAQRREGYVNDTAIAAQAMPADISKHVKTIRRSVGNKASVGKENNSDDFMKEVGSF